MLLRPRFRNDLTADLVRSLLHYDLETGIFTWKVDRARHVCAGDIAGTRTPHGYLVIGIRGTNYFAHRLAFLWVKGEWPKAELDHINLLKIDNRWVNLREATRSQNMFNTQDKDKAL